MMLTIYGTCWFRINFIFNREMYSNVNFRFIIYIIHTFTGSYNLYGFIIIGLLLFHLIVFCLHQSCIQFIILLFLLLLYTLTSPLFYRFTHVTNSAKERGYFFPLPNLSSFKCLPGLSVSGVFLCLLWPFFSLAVFSSGFILINTLPFLLCQKNPWFISRYVENIFTVKIELTEEKISFL